MSDAQTPDSRPRLIMYPGESITVDSTEDTVPTIIQVRPRPIQFLADTNTNASNVQILIDDHNHVMERFYFREGQTALTPQMRFNQNTITTIEIPQSLVDGSVIINSSPYSPATHPFLPDLTIPLRELLDPSRTDPVRVFIFNPQEYTNSRPWAPVVEGDMSYLSGMPQPTIEDEDNALYAHELQRNLDLSEGFHSVDSLSDEQVVLIMEEVLGSDYRETIDAARLQQDDPAFWTATRVADIVVEGAHGAYLSRYALRDFGFRGRFYIKGGKNGAQYVIFRGARAMKKWFTAYRYSVLNPKVVGLSASISPSMAGTAMANSARSLARGAGRGTLVIAGGVAIIEWLISDDRDVESLLVGLGMSLLKAAIATTVGAGLASVLIGAVLMLVGAATAPVWLVVAGAVVIGVAVGTALDWLDHRFGVTDYVTERARGGRNFLGEVWDDAVHSLGSVLYQLEQAILRQYAYRPFSGR